jgi:hypothetical protein
MLGADRRSLTLWAIMPSSLLIGACASSGSGLDLSGVSVGGQSTNGGATTQGGTSSTSAVAIGGTASGASSSSEGGAATTQGGSEGGRASQGGSASGGMPNGGANQGGSLPANGGSPNGGTVATNGGTSAANGGSSTGKGGTSNANAGSATKGGAAHGGAKSGGAAGKTAAAGSSTAQAGAVGAGSTCGNGTKDDDESDIDCGGACAPAYRCGVGAACVDAGDCLTSSCISKACAEPTVVVKNAGCVGSSTACPSVGSTLQAKIQMINVGTAALALKGVEIRYYYTDENTASGTPVIEVYDKSISTYDISIVAMPTPADTADHYVKITYSAGSIDPDLNRVCERSNPPDCADITFAIHSANYQGNYDPSNDYSFVPSPALVNNSRITVHQGSSIIWGTPP